jgi:hypothetical protein
LKGRLRLPLEAQSVPEYGQPESKPHDQPQYAVSEEQA